MKKERIGILIKVIALSFVVVLATGAAFAWFSTGYESEKGVQYQTGDGTFSNMHAWMYNMNLEDTGEDTAKAGTWVSAPTAMNASPSSDTTIAIDSEKEGYQLNRVVEYEYTLTSDNSIVNGKTYYTRSGSEGSYVYTKVASPVVGDIRSYYECNGTEKFYFRSLHLGTIDNLLSLSYDNYLYLRFDIITPRTQGRLALASYQIGEEDFHFYDSEKNDQTVAVLDKADTYGKRSIFSEMVGVDCVGSTSAYTPSASISDIETLFTNDGVTLVNGADITEIYEDTDDTTYYFYVRFYPDLEKCTEATDYFGEFMPCEILFDIEFTLEFRFYEGDLDE